MWVKALLCVLVLMSAEKVRRISNLLGYASSEESRDFLIFSPMLIFASLFFGQIDIIAVFIGVVALDFYFKRRYWTFSAIMAIAFCIKGFIIFIYIPLLLLVEKNIVQLIKHIFCFAWCYILTYLCFMNTESFRIIAEGHNKIQHFSELMFYSTVRFGPSEVYLLPAFMFVLCAICYGIKPKAGELRKYAVFIPICSYTIVIMFLSWHPQWTILIIPFWAMALNFVYDEKFFLILDIFVEGAFIITCCVKFRHNVDDAMVNYGILGKLFQCSYDGGYLGKVYDYFKLPAHLPFSVMAAAMISLAWFIYASMFSEKNSVQRDNNICLYNCIRYSIAILFVMASLILWCIKRY